MKIFIFLISTAVFGFTPAKLNSQERVVIDIDMTVTVDEVFSIIKKQTDFKFIYKKGIFKDFQKINLKKGTIGVTRLLNNCLSVNKNIEIIVTSDNTILIKERKKSQQDQEIKGKVTDNKGMPIVGATVLVKGTSYGVVTDFDGGYTIKVKDSKNILVFSYLGFKKQEILVGNQTTINIIMIEDVSSLDAVVIRAGYYNVKEREKTGSIAKVKAKDIEKQPTNNVLAAIQSQVSGLDITQDSGLNGGGFQIRIRGLNSINGNSNPLILINGVPFDSESLSNDVVNFIGGGNISPLNGLNPSDIESVEVLKDADATAIYGSRGANGVILITTKTGKAGKTRISLNTSVTLSKASFFQDLMNTEQYLEVRREAFANNNIDPLTNNTNINDADIDGTWDPTRYTDWQKTLAGGTAIRKNTQLSFSGGSEQTQFYINGAYLNETTVFPTDLDYTRLSIQSSINHQSKDKRFSIGLTTNYSSDDNNVPAINFYQIAQDLAPNAPALFDDEGNLNWERSNRRGFFNSSWNNPLAALNELFNSKTTNLVTNANISYKLTDKMLISSRFGYTDVIFEEYNATPFTKTRDPQSGFAIPFFSSLATSNSRRSSWVVEPQLNYDTDWNKFEFKFLVGSTFQSRSTDGLAVSRSNFPTDELILNPTAAAVSEDINFRDEDYRFASVFGRINVNYDSKYFLNITGRRDGSSRFGPGKRFGNFGAVGAAWIFSRESFLEDESKIFSFGKFRGSFGLTGSDNLSQGAFLDTYTTVPNGADYDFIVGLEPTKIPNPDLQWETNKKLEFALETGFFNDRILLTLAWYRNRSGNQLVTEPLSEVTGFRTIRRNLDAIVENKGLEIDLQTVNIDTDDFTWKTTFNYSKSRNKLVKFDELANSGFSRQFIVGESLFINRYYEALGVNPETGIYEFTDANNDGTINFEGDAVVLKDLSPSYFGSFANNIRYKNFQFNFLFQYRKQKGPSFFAAGSRPGTLLDNYPVQFLDRWQAPGDIATIQQYFGNTSLNQALTRAAGQQQASTAGITDASFIRLKSASLSYDLPKETFKNVGVNIFIQGQNLFLITKYDVADPETGPGAFPLLRQFTLGFNFTF